MADISISDDLIERIETRAEHTEFETADDYAEYVLHEVLASLDADGADRREPAVDDEGVEDRLQSLGYLNE
ncbi:hypothetical protein C475_01247 [Halosimplex carlsbadense 2-9-1]|uniref:CopG family transcriptional regulator n=1 Tax=Halosimplex carlsbadense 2-9-1 TaxID=797114 RepID=M0D634_9EURY|nr:hypothetical protein [Halosimplex carlsbadense]ELZ30318.1 hypothetical protein C475_01247 [Halosimplex carlsbadense 2-9-1]